MELLFQADTLWTDARDPTVVDGALGSLDVFPKSKGIVNRRLRNLECVLLILFVSSLKYYWKARTAMAPFARAFECVTR